MRLAINAASAKMGGAVTYLTNLLAFLPPPESGEEFVVFLPPETAEMQTGVAANIRLVPTIVGRASWWKRIWWEQITLRRLLNRENIDALYSTANFGMLRCPVRQLLVVRNSLYFSEIYENTFIARHSFRTRMAFKLRRWLIRRSVRSADVVMTPTRTMRDELCRCTKVPESKVRVNPFGAAETGDKDGETSPKSSRSAEPSSSQVRLLFISLYAEHKNLTTLLKALLLLNRESSKRFFLKTTANPAWAGAVWTLTYRTDLALASHPAVSQWVEFLSPSSPQSTGELYQDADVFVFPSLTESFGHPLVEAMSHGLPIVAADTPVNREICGDAAVYFSPLSPEELAQQIRCLAEDGALATSLVVAGRLRATSCFRMDEHVRRIMGFLRTTHEAAANPRIECART